MLTCLRRTHGNNEARARLPVNDAEMRCRERISGAQADELRMCRRAFGIEGCNAHQEVARGWIFEYVNAAALQIFALSREDLVEEGKPFRKSLWGIECDGSERGQGIKAFAVARTGLRASMRLVIGVPRF